EVDRVTARRCARRERGRVVDGGRRADGGGDRDDVREEGRPLEVDDADVVEAGEVPGRGGGARGAEGEDGGRGGAAEERALEEGARARRAVQGAEGEAGGAGEQDAER